MQSPLIDVSNGRSPAFTLFKDMDCSPPVSAQLKEVQELEQETAQLDLRCGGPLVIAVEESDTATVRSTSRCRAVDAAMCVP